MAIDFKLLELKLAEYKVYDAWYYVESLRETLTYMNTSYEMILKVYEHRVNTLKDLENDIVKTALNEGQSAFGEKELKKTELSIGGYDIDDVVFLKKTTLEFLHCARISMDILFQIVNAGLFGDKSIPVSESSLLEKVLNELKKKSEFRTLLGLLNTNYRNPEFKYLQAFDNYIKHIKTILITIKNSFMLGNTNKFVINEFCYKGKFYKEENAIDKIKDINDYVLSIIDKILFEVLQQIPNCLDNSHRIQTLSYRLENKKTVKGNTFEYVSFFIEVDNDLRDLPTEIKVLPLIIKPNDEIYSFDFRFDKIFIKKKGCDEMSIMGYAKLKNGLDTNEFYRVFSIHECRLVDYINYIDTFKNKYTKISMNLFAMEGRIIFIS